MSSETLITLANFAAGGFLIFLAITITRDNFVNRINRATGAMLFFAGLGPVFLALGSIITTGPDADPDFNRRALYQVHTLWEMFFPTLLIFAWLFPVDRMREFRSTRLRTLIFVPQAMHLIIMLFFGDINKLMEMVKLDPTREGFTTIVLSPFSYLFTSVLQMVNVIRSYEQVIFDSINLLYVVAAIYFMETGHRFLKEPRLVSQTRIVLWSLRLGLGFFLAATLSHLFFDRYVPAQFNSAILVIGLVLAAGVLAFAIIRYQFLDVQLIFRQSFIYTLASALLVGGYIVIGVKSQTMLVPLFGDRAQVISYVFLALILLLFQPIASWVDNVIRSMFMRTRSDYRNVIERFSRQVISMFDPRQLRQTIDETLKTALLVENVYFILYDDSIGEYAILPSEDNANRVVIQREDLMLRGINLLDAPTHFGSLSQYETDSQLADFLKERKVKLILPMKDAKHLLGFLALTNKAAGYRYSSEDFNLLGVLSNQMVSALTNARLYVESLERMRLQEEVTMARQIQLDLLPASPPQLECSIIHAQSIPSRTVGGDFYDFIPIKGDTRWGMVIADASGKGMPAALMIAQIQAMIRSEINNGNPIPMMLKNVNKQVALSTSSEKYVTLFYGELDTTCGTFTYANAGHNYPILVRKDGGMELLQTGGPIVGAFPFLEFTSASVPLKEGDLLFFFTDGLSEAMDADGVEYGEERIRNFVRDNRHHEPSKLVEMLMSDVRAFDPSSPPQDDTTIIALKMRANGAIANVQ
ncbi:MAG: SpoIIE family protein phosphatase [bacterium]|nr:SpoIIE family protein phosphatase [bacterium]